MLEAKVYSSQAPSTPKALLDIGSEFHRDALDADFILVFASAHHANGGQQLNDALKDIFGDTPFLGWFGTSAYHSDLIPEWQPALIFMALKGINAHVSSTSTHALGSHVGVSLLADSPTGEHRFLCLNSEPIDFEGLLTTLDEQAVPLPAPFHCLPKRRTSHHLLCGLQSGPCCSHR